MNSIKKQLFAFSLLFLVSVLLSSYSTSQNMEIIPDVEYDNCTSIMVGKAATADGSTITSHTCDSGTDRTWINVVPHRKFKAGEKTPVFTDPKRSSGPNDPKTIEAGVIKQARETYAYINAAYPIMNEYQLAIGESTFGGKRELMSSAGMIDCPELYRLALERAKTCREAIMVIDELTKEYGYNDSGECFSFSDPNEVWHFEIVGPGKGKIGAVWAAVRIPDDEVGVSANASRIRTIDLKDTKNYMASDNVFSVAEEMGLWSSKSGKPFEFCYAYADRNSMGCRRREWIALNLAAPSLRLDPNAENYPFSVKAEKKLTINDVLDIFRNYYQDTPYDMTATMETKDREGNVIKSPIANPFLNSDLRTMLRIPSERTIACARATYVQITQSRSWLPDAIGGLVWLGYDNPCTTPHIPFYCGITKMPDSYMVDGRREYSHDCAWWSFRRVSKLCGFRYNVMSKDVEEVWKEIESKAFADQPGFEKEMVALYKKNPEAAIQGLTKYSVDMAEKSVKRYWLLGDQLWAKYNNYF